MAVLICFTSIMSWETCANAQDSDDIEMSELMTEDALIGYAQS